MAAPDALAAIFDDQTPIACGAAAAKHFAHDEGYINLNHGSYGTYPIEIRDVLRYYQSRVEARPDAFVRYSYRTTLRDEERAALARYLHAPPSTCVLTPNASTAFETILRNLDFRSGDVVIYFDTVYESFENTLTYLSETTPVQLVRLLYRLPASDDELCDLFVATLNTQRQIGRTPRLAVFDTISSLPGTNMPYERLTALCKQHRVLSCVDGAHGVGLLSLDLPALDPDFFMSNCHKWLYVPRACGMLYVPERNQHFLRATLPVGFQFVPKYREPPGQGPALPSRRTPFEANFSSVGTLDDTPNLCIRAALAWRRRIRWRQHSGDAAVKGYITQLAAEGGHLVASRLGTQVLDNAQGTLTARSSIVNVRLPLDPTVIGSQARPPVNPRVVTAWIMRSLIEEHSIGVVIFYYADAWWVRLCAQIYLTLVHFERAAESLIEVCARARERDWSTA